MSAEVHPRGNKRPVPVLALSIEEACAALGVSWDFFREHVAPELRVVRVGRRRLIAVRELERWLDANAAQALEPRSPKDRPICHGHE